MLIIRRRCVLMSNVQEARFENFNGHYVTICLWDYAMELREELLRVKLMNK